MPESFYNPWLKAFGPIFRLILIPGSVSAWRKFKKFQVSVLFHCHFFLAMIICFSNPLKPFCLCATLRLFLVDNSSSNFQKRWLATTSKPHFQIIMGAYLGPCSANTVIFVKEKHLLGNGHKSFLTTCFLSSVSFCLSVILYALTTVT